MSVFKKGDYVHNDHLVGEMVKPLLDWRVKYCKNSLILFNVILIYENEQKPIKLNTFLF